LLLSGSFLFGGVPLTDWLYRLVRGQSLATLGTGNLSVSAAFRHGGSQAGVPAALAEAGRGALVALAAPLVAGEGPWVPLALAALVSGRFVLARAAGATNAFWGLMVWSPVATLIALAVGLCTWAVSRKRRFAQLAGLVSLPTALSLTGAAPATVLAVCGLAGLLAWVLHRSPDDLALVPSLDERLSAAAFGGKAANLSRLRRAGLPVPSGWVLRPGDDVERLLAYRRPSPHRPWIVRSSATGEDSAVGSAAGQYLSLGDIVDEASLRRAVSQVRTSYDLPAAVRYRRDRGLGEGMMAVLVQEQIAGRVSGVLFTRDPLDGRDALVIEAVPGGAAAVVGGRVTPERCTLPRQGHTVEGEVGLSAAALDQLRTLALQIEEIFENTPQDIEWTWDGRRIWILQARPITTLLPVWTRTIAAEVIPGAIRPLTWSLNRPLTCGVWGEIFTLVLGRRAEGIDFNQTATLIDGWAYFNATLLGQIFLRMGLPPESLDFLYRGSRFSRPPLRSLVENLPGLGRLLAADLDLERSFTVLEAEQFAPLLAEIEAEPNERLRTATLIERSARIQASLRLVTYYNILAPVGLALRRVLFGVREEWLSPTAEVAAVRELGELGQRAFRLIGARPPEEVMPALEQSAVGRDLIGELHQFLKRYGYLSEVGTDIAVPTWSEHPQSVVDLFVALSQLPPPPAAEARLPHSAFERWRTQIVDRRARLRSRIATVYDRLLAHLRWTFVALEQRLIAAGRLSEPGDLFFLEQSELRQLVTGHLAEPMGIIRERRTAHERQRQRRRVPRIVYGGTMPPDESTPTLEDNPRRLKGIAASRGQAVGRVRVLHSLTGVSTLSPDTVLVVPYTDAGWAPLLAQAAALVCEVGGRLSHGAIVAREYGLPAVMNVSCATHVLVDGQRVRVDGGTGTVELLIESN
jgi:pyruvate,water dikinase